MRWPEGDSVKAGPPGPRGPGPLFMCARRDMLSLRRSDHLIAPVSLPARSPLHKEDIVISMQKPETAFDSCAAATCPWEQ